jgi:hypothetical protein
MPVPVILSQETLAEMIGTTRSRVRFFMNKFSNKGIHLTTERARFIARCWTHCYGTNHE